jgi:hypothetical protein
MKGLSWVNFILGLWFIVAPLALHYGDIVVAMWNNVILGIVRGSHPCHIPGSGKVRSGAVAPAA